MSGEGKADVEIVLSRPQWKMNEPKNKETTKNEGGKEERKHNKTIVGCMLGMYMFENKGQKLFKKDDCLDEVTFYPKNEIIISKQLDCKENGYIIMPCTFKVVVHNNYLKIGSTRRTLYDISDFEQ